MRFTEVGYQVNHMLDSIQALNDRNTELFEAEQPD